MEASIILLVALIVLVIACLGLVIYVITLLKSRSGLEKELSALKAELRADITNQKNDISTLRTELLSGVNSSVSNIGQMMEGRLKSSESTTEQKLEAIRQSMERGLLSMQQENGKRLEQMQTIVEEKLQKTLDDRVSRSFQTVSDQLEKVYKGLGEMQSVASGVSDLKKVLSNVKTRGILGEIQLGAILEELLSPEQYDKNVVTVPNSREAVEFAIKLPGEGGDTVYLPVDSKFPADYFATLQDAYQSGAKEQVDAAAARLIARLKQEAKEIRSKYVSPPHTTEFAIMFLPFEGLYAEAVNRGLIEELQRTYRITVAGPSTMAALLNSLQMGFRTLAIQKRSAEVWQVLGAVRTEFDKFGDVLESSRQRLNKVNDELDLLIGTRTRQIQRKLKEVQSLDSDSARKLIDE